MARRGIAANYPGKKGLTEAERARVLHSGADPAWFHPWALRAVLLPGEAQRGRRYGYVHVTGSTAGSFLYDVHLFWDQPGLSWALEHLYKTHPQCNDECHGLYYFMPDEPVRLHMVIETADEDDEPEPSQ